MNETCPTTQQITNAGNLCEDPATKGFDLEAGQSWIYPTNYPIRTYQYNIIQEALHKNTLVSLPTGLGKTFIAAVVMYNFYRWYPHGKVIFMAPTRPLVEQQIDACYNIMAIPQEVTAELTGVKRAQAGRAEVWQAKRVFFITPQVLQNDLDSVLELGTKIKCLVFDEAHRAKGNYAYCEVIRRLVPRNKLFRVLALSATPGNSLKDIGEVMQNLLIAHLEFRNEQSEDVKEYVFNRSLETVVVPLGDKLQQVKADYEQILEGYARTLIKFKVVFGNFTNLTKGKLHMVKKEFQAKNRGCGTPHYGEIMKTLNVCITLYHGYEALIRCGLRIFLSYFEEHVNNPPLSANTALIRIVEDLRTYLGPTPEVHCLPDGSFAQMSVSTKFGHPKFYYLRDTLLAHFATCEPSSRVIIFFEYKESVKEAYAILSQNYPTIKPRIFVGQGAGVRQKDQVYTVRAFREGNCNTLLSTCVGEEGLDVGEVDLIVCFDTTNRSPIRMIQRMGRTGRKKAGRVIVLVTEGREQQTVKDSLVCRNNLDSVMTNSSHLEPVKYTENPAMIPSYVQPRCRKMFITVQKPTFTKNHTIKSMFKSMSWDGVKFPDDMEVVEVEERIKTETEYLWNKASPMEYHQDVQFGKRLEQQRVLQPCGEVGHSKCTEVFVDLLQFADCRRFNIPMTDSCGVGFSKRLKQSDIRNMFTKNSTTTTDLSQVPCSFNSAISGLEKEDELFVQLFQELTDFLLIRLGQDEECKTCMNLFHCPMFYYSQQTHEPKSWWVPPDLSIVDTITKQDLQVFVDSLKSEKLAESLDMDNDIFDDFTELDRIEEDCQIRKLEENSFAYETPKSFTKLLHSFHIGDSEKIAENTDIIKAISYSDEDILSFFQLASVEDLFVDDVCNVSVDSERTLILTPVADKSVTIFQTTPDLFGSSEKKQDFTMKDPVSPVLGSSESVQNTAKKKLFEDTDQVINKPNLSKLKLPHKRFHQSNRPCDNQDLDISNVCDLSEFGISKEMLAQSERKIMKNASPIKLVNVDISDICDLSIFGLGESTLDKNNLNCLNSPVQDNDDKDFHHIVKDSIREIKATTQAANESFTELLKASDLSSFADEEFFEPPQNNAKDKHKKPSHIQTKDISNNPLHFTSNSELCADPKKTDTPIIDLTSPKGKTSTQLSITQMLSLISKSESSTTTKSSSQKENSPCLISKPKKTVKKSILSLNNNTRDVTNFHDQSKQSLTPKQKSNGTPRTRPKSKFNLSLSLNSDDEFEECSSPVFSKPKSCTETSYVRETVKKSPTLRERKRKKLFSEFIEEEAVLCDSVAVSEDEEESGDDCYEASFVNDATQPDLNSTTMHAHYLKTTTSPLVRGRFKIPQRPTHNIVDLFSQEVDNADNTYLNDSFVVNTEDIVDSSSQHELSELEILEEKLRKMRKTKKKRKSEEPSGVNQKKRKIVVLSDSD